MSEAPIVNISCYKFAALFDLRSLRTRLLDRAKTLGLKGTILISAEGVNFFLSGPRPQVDEMVEELRSIPGLEDLNPKYSPSDHQVFNRMLVRIKKEIIAFGVDGIDPAKRTSPKLSARELKQWLDEGRPVTLYDTRNDYEVKLGTFKNAIPAKIDTFRDFPRAVRELPPEMKEQPIVMFCTGGIRCEKAGPFMEREGFKHIYQLDGGILKYFEEVGGDHYEGECFVFDQRVGVDPALGETLSAQCYKCQTPLNAEEQKHPHYQPPHSCPYCYITPELEREQTLAARQAKLAQISQPLPGCTPYDNRRPLIVPGTHDGSRLIDFLDAILGHVPHETWVEICASGRMRTQDDAILDADSILRGGQRIVHLIPGQIEPPVSADIRILYEDTAIVVLHKPAPLPMHPSGRFNRNTLSYFLDQIYAPNRPRPAHRLDANTTGVVVCARTRHMAGLIQPQFAQNKVQKSYLVRVHGKPTSESFSSEAPISSQPGPAGVRIIDHDNGLAARTDFKVISYRESDDTTLLEARPLTGRTNQIRLHLWDLDLPVCGDPLYLKNRKFGDQQTLEIEASGLCLHAWKISFQHPQTRETVSFTAPAPEWADHT